MILKDGFYTALGTPIDENGKIIEESLRIEIEQQIANEASGMLLLGSMGMEPCVVMSECIRAAKIASDAVAGRVPLFVGVMDNSIAGVKARIDGMKGLNITGIVLTTPFYFTSPTVTLLNWFTQIADYSPFPVFLYDLPVSVKEKITYPMVVKLAKHPKIMGIKTADINMIMEIGLRGEVKKEFTALYSGLDTVDVGYAHGITHFLDGMFATTPKNAKLMKDAFAEGDYKKGNEYLQKILYLRDTMAKFDIFPSFTVTMQLLGMKGFFGPDYDVPVSEEAKAVLKQAMIDIGEL